MERESDPGCFDNKYLRDIILNFVIAGRDTTAGTLSWFLYMLCRNQHIQDKVAREVRAATTGDRDVGVQEFVAFLTEDAISRMQYLHAVLTETLRLYPAVPIVSAPPTPASSSRFWHRTSCAAAIIYLRHGRCMCVCVWGGGDLVSNQKKSKSVHPKNQKKFKIFSSRRIFRHIYEALNIDKNKN